MGQIENFNQHRPILFGIAYRMLGSATEAEDILQDAFLRFQTRSSEEIKSPKAFLSKIVTRLCLNHLNSARVRREMYVGPWLPEPIRSTKLAELANTPISDYDSISMAFLVLLENLTPPERAVFLLREVFDYTYEEIAEILGKSEVACRKLFSRAKKYISSNRPRFKSSPEEHRQILESFMQAAGEGELGGLMNLLAEGVTFWADGGGKARGAATRPVIGRSNVARFVLGTSRSLPPGANFEVLDVNGQPAIVIRTREGAPLTVITIDVGEGTIYCVRAIANPDKLKGI